jgi:hypothetical protein
LVIIFPQQKYKFFIYHLSLCDDVTNKHAFYPSKSNFFIHSMGVVAPYSPSSSAAKLTSFMICDWVAAVPAAAGAPHTLAILSFIFCSKISINCLDEFTNSCSFSIWATIWRWVSMVAEVLIL